MKTAYFRLFISIVLLLLVGCESNNDEFRSNLFSEKEEQLQVYIIFSDFDQQVNSSIKDEIMELFHEHLKGNASVVTLYTQTERIIMEFNIEEFPTILVFDDKDVLLQTTNQDEYKKFVVQYYSD